MWSKRDQTSAFGSTKPLAAKSSHHRGFGRDLTNNGQTALAGKGGLKGARKSVPKTRTMAPTSTEASATDMTSRISLLDLEGASDVDAADRFDPSCVSVYVVEIFENFKRAESRGRVNPSYMSGQKAITSKMRSILVDWLIEVHQKFKLMPETLHLTVNLIDRFLQAKVVERQQLQLVGVTCMLLAAKYEEIYFPEIRDFVYITDNAYTRQQILKMEEVVLNVLQFEMTVPTANCFVKRFIKAANLDTNAKLKPMASFLAERMLQEYEMLRFRPSIIAATSVSMALSILREKSWHSTLTRYTGYAPANLKACAAKMTDILQRAPSSSLKAVQKKYASSRHFGVSNDVRARITSKA